jgi:hypothetical protein
MRFHFARTLWCSKDVFYPRIKGPGLLSPTYHPPACPFTILLPWHPQSPFKCLLDCRSRQCRTAAEGSEKPTPETALMDSPTVKTVKEWMLPDCLPDSRKKDAARRLMAKEKRSGRLPPKVWGEVRNSRPPAFDANARTLSTFPRQMLEANHNQSCQTERKDPDVTENTA